MLEAIELQNMPRKNSHPKVFQTVILQTANDIPLHIEGTLHIIRHVNKQTRNAKHFKPWT
jgi:hypothetical protein